MATFHTNYRLFEPLMIFFGITNSPTMFQTMINDIFRDLITEGIMIVYLGNILISYIYTDIQRPLQGSIYSSRSFS